MKRFYNSANDLVTGPIRQSRGSENLQTTQKLIRKSRKNEFIYEILLVVEDMKKILSNMLLHEKKKIFKRIKKNV